MQTGLYKINSDIRDSYLKYVYHDPAGLITFGEKYYYYVSGFKVLYLLEFCPRYWNGGEENVFYKSLAEDYHNLCQNHGNSIQIASLATHSCYHFREWAAHTTLIKDPLHYFKDKDLEEKIEFNNYVSKVEVRHLESAQKI